VIYKFKSKASADLVMLAATGEHMLQIVGKTDSAKKGILTVAEMPSAIAALEAALAEHDAARREAELEAAKQGLTLPAPGITLRTRAWPFIEMLTKASKAGVDVVWGV
jgi:hypothetical protein